MSLTGDERREIADAVARAREAGVAEELIEREVDGALRLGEDYFAVVSIVGRLRHYSRLREPSHVPAQSPVLPPSRPSDEW